MPNLESIAADHAEHIEQSGIGGNLQIEIHQAVYQYSGHSQQGCQSDRPVGVFRPVLQLSEPIAIHRPQKPEHDGESQPSHLDQQLEIVVVGFVDKEIGVKTSKLGIDIGEYSQSPAR